MVLVTQNGLFNGDQLNHPDVRLPRQHRRAVFAEGGRYGSAEVGLAVFLAVKSVEDAESGFTGTEGIPSTRARFTEHNVTATVQEIPHFLFLPGLRLNQCKKSEFRRHSNLLSHRPNRQGTGLTGV